MEVLIVVCVIALLHRLSVWLHVRKSFDGSGCWMCSMCTHFGWKSWRGAVLLEGLLLFRIMRDARNRKSSNSCWIREGPEQKDRAPHLQHSLKRQCDQRQHTANQRYLSRVHVNESECNRLTKLLLLVATEREQSLNEAQMTGLQDVVGLAGLQLAGPRRLKIIQPVDLILQHGCWADL